MRTAASALALALFAAAAAPLRAEVDRDDPFADAVDSFLPGMFAGFGEDLLPGIVLGPPNGAGLLQGSLDTLSLGHGGVITLHFDLPLICDGPGADFTVFENAFHAGSVSGLIFAEYGSVEVSQDGEHFVAFPFDATTHVGLAGQQPVLSAPDNGVDPLDPTVSGGDQFDLAEVGLAWVAYVRILDGGDAIPDPGDRVPPGDKGGFDLDAIAALHACEPGDAASPTPTGTASETPTATPTPSQIATPSAAVTTTATVAPRPGDLDGDGVVGDADVAWMVREIFDGDGDAAEAAGGGDIASPPTADLGGDGFINAADLAGMRMRRASE